MFTGIIETIGTVQTIAGNQFTLTHDFDETPQTGDSIALSGMCATVLNADKEAFTVEIMGESRNRTIFAKANEGMSINLERSAVIGQRNSGHNVTGHIDEVGTILERKTNGDYELFRIQYTAENQPLVVMKGSIAINGISLTISNLSEQYSPPWFEVSIISHTLEVTNLKHLQVDDLVNLEFDILGKYALKNPPQ